MLYPEKFSIIYQRAAERKGGKAALQFLLNKPRTAAQLQQVVDAGAKFAISPGLTRELLQAGKDAAIPLIPGIASISELMEGTGLGYSHFKFFPAEAAGGVKTLKSIHGPFADIRFCPTGGINEKNFLEYLALPNVKCVGGSWIVPDDAIANGEWDRITQLCVEAVAKAKTVN